MSNVRVLGASDAHEVAVTVSAKCACGRSQQFATWSQALGWIEGHRQAEAEREDQP